MSTSTKKSLFARMAMVLVIVVLILATGQYALAQNIPGDHTPPVISNIGVNSVSVSTATITWTTDEIATSQVELAYGSPENRLKTNPDETLNIQHSVLVENLLANTMYHVFIRSSDSSGNMAISDDFHFSTLAASGGGHTTPPVLSGISPRAITDTSIHIAWTTDEPADSQIEYGTSTSYGSMTALDSTLTLSHDQSLVNLLPDTEYHLRVHSRDSDGNGSVSEDYIFTTLAASLPDPAPVISNVTLAIIGITDATITWDTNEPATSETDYGLTSSYGQSANKIIGLDLTHRQKIENLTPFTLYHFRVVSVDSAGNVSYSIDGTFKTAMVDGSLDTTPPTAINDLSVSSVKQTSLTLSWTAPSDDTGVISYDLNRSNTPLSENTFYGGEVVHQIDLTVDDVEHSGVHHSYNIVGLAPGTTVYFAIKSSDPFGNVSSISNVVPVTTLAAPRGTPSGGGGSVPSQSGGGTPSQNGENPSSSHEGYSYTNTEYTAEGETYQIEDKQPPKKVTDVQAIGLDKVIVLSWKNPNDSDFTRVHIMRSTGDYPVHPGKGDVVYEGSGTTFSDPDLVNGKTYYYSIFAYDEVPNYSEPVQLSIAPYAERRHYHVLSVGSTQSLPITKDLGYGDTDDEVGHVQEILATDPMLYPEGLITGYFGTLTQAAIVRLQHRSNLPETGKVDASVRALLKNLPITQHLTETTSEGIVRALAHDLSFGASGDEVKILQTYLGEQGYLPQGLLTGYFGSQTRQAVILFQQKNNITPAFGYVGPVTRSKILENTQSIPGPAQ